VEIRGLIETAKLESGNGFVVAISPEPGLTGESEGTINRTILVKVSWRKRSSRLETSIPFRWPGDRQSMRGSEKPLREAGSGRKKCRATSKVSIRRSQKEWRGTEELSLDVLAAKL
jgi:hypothetical protein